MILSYIVTLDLDLPTNDNHAVQSYNFSRLRIHETTDVCKHILELGHTELCSIMLDLLEEEYNRLNRIADAWSQHLAAIPASQNVQQVEVYELARQSIRLYRHFITVALSTIDILVASTPQVLPHVVSR